MGLGMGFGGGGGGGVESSSTGISPPLDAIDFDEELMTIIVSAVSGTDPKLDVCVQHSADKQNWKNLYGDFLQGIFPRIEAVGNETIRITKFSQYLRVKYSISGTSPSFTVNFEVLGKKEL